MDIEKAIALLGKPLNDAQMAAFFEQYGFKYPKKTTMSGKTTEPGFWVVHKKRKIDLLFSIEHHSQTYLPPPAERKNTFYPILQSVRIYTDTNIQNMPFGLHLDMDFAEAKARFGEPKSNPYLLNDKGTPFAYYWHLPLSDEKYICLEIRDNGEDPPFVDEIWLNIQTDSPLLQFWYPQTGETYADFVKNLPYDPAKTYKHYPIHHAAVRQVFFLRWLIEQGFIIKTEADQALLQSVQTGSQDVFAFIQTLPLGYVGDEDVIENKRNKVHDYIRNMNHKLPYYGDEIKTLFLTAEEIQKTKQHGMAGDADAWLNPDPMLNERVTYSEENYRKVKAMLDEKLAAKLL